MRATLGAAHLVKHEIAGNFQQPRSELRPRNISARAFPDPDKDLLRDILHVGTATQHACDRACHQCLMLFDELLKRMRVAAADKLHQPHVTGIFFRSALVSSIVLRHRDLDVGTPKSLPEKCDSPNSAGSSPSSSSFLLQPASGLCMLDARLTRVRR